MRQTHFRMSAYLIGIITGYLLYYKGYRKTRHEKYFVLLGWTLSLGFMITHIFCSLRSLFGFYIYEIIYRELWAASICWIIYACHQLKSGWILRSFLSSLFWQPLSKLGLSVYLIHYVYLDLMHLNQKEIIWLGTLPQIHIYIADILISFALGAIFYLTVEAPTCQIVQMTWKYFKRCDSVKLNLLKN